MYVYPLSAPEARALVWMRRLTPVIATAIMGMMAALSLAAG